MQAATFKSFMTANRLEQGQQDKDFASLSAAEIEQPRKRHLQCVLGPGFSVAMVIALGLVVQTSVEAFCKNCPGTDAPAKWVCLLLTCAIMLIAFPEFSLSCCNTLAFQYQ